MDPFAKLYWAEDVGQVLVLLDSNASDGPEIRYTFRPQGLGLCNYSIGFNDTAAGHELAEQVFARVDEHLALHAVRALQDHGQISRIMQLFRSDTCD